MFPGNIIIGCFGIVGDHDATCGRVRYPAPIHPAPDSIVSTYIVSIEWVRVLLSRNPKQSSLPFKPLSQPMNLNLWLD